MTTAERDAAGRWLHDQLATPEGVPPMWRGLRLGVGVIALIVAAVLVAQALGSGTTAILAGISAMFTLVGGFGASLRADVRVLSWFAPSLVVCIGGIHLLAVTSPWLGLTALLVVVAVVGCLSAASPRTRAAGAPLALGAAVGMGLSSVGTDATPAQTFLACAVGTGLVVLWRVLRGLGDPSLRTRAALGRMLTDPSPGAAEEALQLVRTDTPARWMTDVLEAASRYRAARQAVDLHRRRDDPGDGHVERLSAALGERATALARSVAARRPRPPTRDPALSVDGGAAADLAAGVPGLLQAQQRALTDVADADARRVRSPVPVERDRGAARGTVEALRSWRSPQLRHAARSTLGVGLVGTVAALTPDNPFNPALLTTAVGVLAPSTAASATQAVQRAGGAVLGAVVVLVLVTLLPLSMLTTAGQAALVPMFATQQRNPFLNHACTGVLTVLLTVGSGQVEPGAALVGYAVEVVAVVVVVLAVGFTVVPGSRQDPAALVRGAEGALRALLDAVLAAQDTRPLLAEARRTGSALGSAVLVRGTSADARDAVRRAGSAFDGALVDLAALGLLVDGGDVPVAARRSTAEVVRAARRVLDEDVPTPTGAERELTSLLANAVSLRAAGDAVGAGPSVPEP